MQAGVVRANQELSSQQITLVVLSEVNHSIELKPSYTPISLGLSQGVTGVFHHTFYPILYLGQHATDGAVTGISV